MCGVQPAFILVMKDAVSGPQDASHDGHTAASQNLCMKIEITSQLWKLRLRKVSDVDKSSAGY